RELSRGITLERRVLDGLSKRETPVLEPPSRAELRASHDRLTTVLERVDRILEEIARAAQESAGREVELGVESPEIIEAAADLGKKRLSRLTIGHAMTALIGGMAVSFGAVAMACTAGP